MRVPPRNSPDSYHTNRREIIEKPKLRTIKITSKHQTDLTLPTMTMKARISPRPLTVYPYLHRNSQCGSCSTVMPGDICFNCGRLSTLLVTPRPPRMSTNACKQAIQGPVPAPNQGLLEGRPSISQNDQIQTLPLEQERATRACAEQHAFDCQFSEVDDLLDAGRQLEYVHTLAADDRALVRYSGSPHGRFTCSSNAFSNFSTTQAAGPSGSSSNTLRSSSSAVSDILAENGRPHAHVVARWLEDVKPIAGSEARLTGRGVDCRINLHGKIYEWVVFL